MSTEIVNQKIDRLTKALGLEGKSEADLPAAMTEKEFCQRYNCQKAQKVIVKFNMKD